MFIKIQLKKFGLNEQHVLSKIGQILLYNWYFFYLFKKWFEKALKNFRFRINEILLSYAFANSVTNLYL